MLFTVYCILRPALNGLIFIFLYIPWGISSEMVHLECMGDGTDVELGTEVAEFVCLLPYFLSASATW